MESDLTAILLCGGKGERLRPITESIPKPLVTLHGKPILHHLVNYLANAGIKRQIFCVGYKADMIKEYVRKSLPKSIEAVFVDSGDASMTDRILDAKKHVRGRAMICYGDTLANIDLRALIRTHERKKAYATLAVYPLTSPYGIVDFESSKKIKKFLEKPRLPYWINIGYLVCDPVALNMIKRGSDMPEFLDSLVKAKKLFAFQHSSKHLTVNTEKDRKDAESAVTEMFTV